MEYFRLRRIADDSEIFAAMLNMRERYPHLPVTGARVIGQDPNDSQRGFHIDAGSNDGIAPNMAVITEGGLGGMVSRVSPARSQVISILDPRFSAAVISTRTEDTGVVSGDIRLMRLGLVRMNHISAAAAIMPGDEIMTSHHSSIFPQGLFVGTVISIHTNPDGLTRHAIIQPSAQATPDAVLVITKDLCEIGGVEIWEDE